MIYKYLLLIYVKILHHVQIGKFLVVWVTRIFFINLAWKQANRQFFPKPCVLGSRGRKVFPSGTTMRLGSIGAHSEAHGRVKCEDNVVFFVHWLIFFNTFILELGIIFSLIVLSLQTFLNSMDLYFPASRTPCDVMICRITWIFTKMIQNTYVLAGFGKKWTYKDSNENNTKCLFNHKLLL